MSLHPLHPEQAGKETDYIAQSARLVATFRVLDQVHLASAREGRKALVFVELLPMQDWLKAAIRRRYSLKQDPLLINGEVVGAERQRRVNDFQNRPNEFEVMILSPKAGGVGLTLTAANHVIHLSRWWNPAVEDQCSDRVYRIGQERMVHVHYPMAIHPGYSEASFDLTLDALLTRKRAMSRDFLAGSAASEQDLRDLFAQTVNASQGQASQDATLSPEDFDAMEPRAFERWTAHRLQRVGWDVRTPPLSHDGGADVVARRNGEIMIVQCKHTQTPQTAMNKGIDDLLRTRQGYGSGRLVLVSNAAGFTSAIRSAAAEHSVRLVARNDLLAWPN